MNSSIPTPSINSVLKFDLKQLNTQVQSSNALLQRFMPNDEPEPLWDHSPEFLVQDGCITWNESLTDNQKVDRDLQLALAPRQLFQAEESLSESLTSSASDDSTFVNDQMKEKTSIYLSRSDEKRQALRRKQDQSR